MSVDLVNDHVLIPHLPDAGVAVVADRVWQNDVSRALSGEEHRVAMRQRPRRRLRWGIVSRDLPEQSRMRARLMAARLSGYGCAPLWGRGIKAASYAGDTITLAASPWAFLEAGDYVLARELLAADPENWAALTVDSISGNDVTFTASLPASFTGGLRLWPLLFGRFQCDRIPHRDNWHSTVNCELVELDPKPMIPPSEVELITNGTLEADGGAGTAWTFSSSAAPHGFYSHYTGRAPIWGGLATQDVITGTYDFFSDVAGPGWSRMRQDFSVPASVAVATLSWKDRILKTAFSTWADGINEIKVSIRTTADVELLEAFGSAPGDPNLATGPNSRSVDVTSLLQANLGGTLRLQIDVIHNADYINYYVDDLSILAS